jgi:hypothetical protein
VAAHAWLLVAVGVYLTITLADRVIGANIGAGLGMLAFAALGLPWSLLGLLGVITPPGDIGETVLYITCALLNLALHATLGVAAVRAGERSSRRGSASPPP